MEFVTKRHLMHASYMSHAHAPFTSPVASTNLPCVSEHPSSSSANFPVIAIIVIGMVATSFFLVSYYVFVFKCCFNLQRANLARLVSLSWQREEPSGSNSRASEPRGLEETVIRLIPVIHYKKESERDFGERSFCECAVCLNEFREDEKLRVIPNCSHVFHINCIDVWLQDNANCPLCRRSISLISQPRFDDQLLTPRPSPQDQSPRVENEDFVVIDLGNEDGSRGQILQGRIEERGSSLELPECPNDHRIVQKKARKLDKVTSLGDEYIGVRAKDERFLVQSIRRSFSMDSSENRQFCLAVQEAMQQQNGRVNEVNSIEVCGGSGGAKRSFFSFGHGSRTRSAVLPVYLDP